MQRLTSHFRRGGLGRAGVSSFGATLGDYCVFAALFSAGAAAAVATFWGCVLGGMLNFTVNRVWAFESRGPILIAALRYATVSGSSALANAMLVAVATSGFGGSARVSWTLARGLVFLGLTYPLFRGWVFGPKSLAGESKSPDPDSEPLAVMTAP